MGVSEEIANGRCPCGQGGVALPEGGPASSGPSIRCWSRSKETRPAVTSSVMGAGASHELLAELHDQQQRGLVNVEDRPLNDRGVELLGGILRDARGVRRLRVGGCSLSGAGLQRMVDALCISSEPCRLRRLDLTTCRGLQKGNPIGDSGARALAMLISRAPFLQHVVAVGCDIGDTGAKHIAHSLLNNGHLQVLDLGHNVVGEQGARALGRALESNYHLRGLLLWGNRVFHSGAEALAEGLAQNSTLEWLGLGCNRIGDAGAQAFAVLLLSQHCQLKWLALGANGITDVGAGYLAEGLRSHPPSTLRHTIARLKGEGISPTLHDRASELSRPENSVTSLSQDSSGEFPEASHSFGQDGASRDDEEGVGGSAEEGEEGEDFCCSLESLGLGGNRLSDEGVTSLAAALTHNTRLQSLSLSDNKVGNKGAQALADMVRTTATLQKLILSSNSIRSAGASQLVAALSQNSSLKQLFLANNPLGDAVVERCLEVLGRYNNTLEQLDVHGTSISREALEKLVLSLKDSEVRMLGSERLPMSIAKGTEAPTSGNILELAPVLPRDSVYMLGSLPSRKTGLFPDSIPWTQPMSAQLTSLPLPEESAQALIMKERRRRSSISTMFRKFSRKGSAGIFRRGEVADISHATVHSNTSQTSSQLSVRRGARGRQELATRTAAMEMQTLTEESLETPGGGDDGMGPTQGSHVLTADTMLVDEESASEPEEDLMPLSPSDSVKRYTIPQPGEEAWHLDARHHGRYTKRKSSVKGPGIEVEAELAQPSVDVMETSFVGPTEEARYTHDPRPSHLHVDAFDVPRDPSLHSLTRDRPLPPRSRRVHKESSLLSHTSTRSNESRATSCVTTPTGANGLERWRGAAFAAEQDWGLTGEEAGLREGLEEGESDVDADPVPQLRQSIMSSDSSGIGNSRILAKSVPIVNSMDPELALGAQGAEEKSLKEQWKLALAMRVGVIRMGGFLRSVFEGIERQSQKAEFDFTAAKLPVNAPKNRPHAPLPPGHSRVRLSFYDSLGSDYINASFVGPPDKDHAYIVCPAPLEGTVEDFWRMVWEQGTRTIVMVTGEMEQGKKACERYWPDSDFDESCALVVGSTVVDDALTVSLLSEGQGQVPGEVVRMILLSSSLDRSTRQVVQYHYTSWPQHATAESAEDVAALVLRVETERQAGPTVPVVVHSSLGAGRAGCFVAVAVAKLLMDSHSEYVAWDSDSNLLDQVIRGLRQLRPGLVENSRQFEFCHKVLEQVLWGKVAMEMARAAEHKRTKGKRKWWQLRKKTESGSKGGGGAKGGRKTKKQQKLLSSDYLF